MIRWQLTVRIDHIPSHLMPIGLQKAQTNPPVADRESQRMRLLIEE
jgi:hypothetical protein